MTLPKTLTPLPNALALFSWQASITTADAHQHWCVLVRVRSRCCIGYSLRNLPTARPAPFWPTPSTIHDEGSGLRHTFVRNANISATQAARVSQFVGCFLVFFVILTPQFCSHPLFLFGFPYINGIRSRRTRRTSKECIRTNIRNGRDSRKTNMSWRKRSSSSSCSSSSCSPSFCSCRSCYS